MAIQRTENTIKKYEKFLRYIKRFSTSAPIDTETIRMGINYFKVSSNFHIILVELKILTKISAREYRWNSGKVTEEQAIEVLNALRAKIKESLVKLH